MSSLHVSFAFLQLLGNFQIITSIFQVVSKSKKLGNYLRNTLRNFLRIFFKLSIVNCQLFLPSAFLSTLAACFWDLCSNTKSWKQLSFQQKGAWNGSGTLRLLQANCICDPPQALQVVYICRHMYIYYCTYAYFQTSEEKCFFQTYNQARCQSSSEVFLYFSD